MQWKEWVKNQANNIFKFDQPKELPSRVGKYIVVDLKYDPDWVWSLRILTVPRGDEKTLVDFRIFDPEKARLQGLDLRDYNSLDSHPEAVLFEGWYNRRTWEMEVQPANIRVI